MSTYFSLCLSPLYFSHICTATLVFAILYSFSHILFFVTRGVCRAGAASSFLLKCQILSEPSPPCEIIEDLWSGSVPGTSRFKSACSKCRACRHARPLSVPPCSRPLQGAFGQSFHVGAYCTALDRLSPHHTGNPPLRIQAPGLQPWLFLHNPWQAHDVRMALAQVLAETKTEKKKKRKYRQRDKGELVKNFLFKVISSCLAKHVEPSLLIQAMFRGSHTSIMVSQD